jgi:2-keto-3-deoxy-L-rhamnonate aldolase RhmA
MRTFQPGALSQKLRNGEAISIIGSAVPGTYLTEAMAAVGYDAVWLDLQHTQTDLSQLSDMARAVRVQGSAPMVRVAALDESIIGRIMDMGVWSIVCPMVSSPDHAETFVRACSYHPRGNRSWGPYLGTVAAGQSAADYFSRAEHDVVPIAMIETLEGLKNADAIMATPGLRGIYVGTSDLSIELGLGPVPDVKHPLLRGHLRDLIRIGQNHGVAVGGYAAAIADTIGLRADGARLLWAGSDHAFAREEAANRFKILNVH